MMIRWSTAVVLLAIAVPPARASADDKLAVLPLEAQRVPEGASKIVNTLLVDAIHRRTHAEVVGAADMEAMLGLERLKDALGCDDIACAAEISGALDVNQIVSGSLALLGDEMILSLVLIDTRQSRVVARSLIRTQERESHWADAVEEAAAQLFGLPAPAPTTAVLHQRPTSDDRPPPGVSKVDWQSYTRYSDAAREAQLEPVPFTAWRKEIQSKQSEWLRFLRERAAALAEGQPPFEYEAWLAKRHDRRAENDREAEQRRRSMKLRAFVSFGGAAVLAGASAALFLSRPSHAEEYAALAHADESSRDDARADLEGVLRTHNTLTVSAWAVAALAAMGAGFGVYQLLAMPPKPQVALAPLYDGRAMGLTVAGWF